MSDDLMAALKRWFEARKAVLSYEEHSSADWKAAWSELGNAEAALAKFYISDSPRV